MREPTDRRIVMLCTGNAARSVMGAVMMRRRRRDLDVIGAGTHAIEGLPMSGRTRNALARHGLANPDHRSHQLVDADLDGVAMVVAFASEHVSYVRRHHPDVSDRTATLPFFARSLPSGTAPLIDRVRSLDLREVHLDGQYDVDDPAGGDEATFIHCADEISMLIDQLLERL
jgi:protein-tyrosine-phosphatase